MITFHYEVDIPLIDSYWHDHEALLQLYKASGLGFKLYQEIVNNDLSYLIDSHAEWGKITEKYRIDIDK